MGAPASSVEHSPVSEAEFELLPGTPDFFGSCYSYAQKLAPNLPINRVVLQSVLLCILAGNRSLVLCTRDEDVALLANTTAYVSQFPQPRAHMSLKPRHARLSPAIPSTIDNEQCVPLFAAYGK